MNMKLMGMILYTYMNIHLCEIPQDMFKLLKKYEKFL